MPNSNSTERVKVKRADRVTAQRGGPHIERTAAGITLQFPVLRAPGVALSLGAFAAVCGLIPALGLLALPPIRGDTAAFLSLALIGGLAAPFMLAAVVFAVLAIYLAANSLHVYIDNEGVRSTRRVFGVVTAMRAIARSDVTDIEPRIGARYQNVFSSIPRYALIARHASSNTQGRDNDVIVAEDLAGQSLMSETRSLLLAALSIQDDKIIE